MAPETWSPLDDEIEIRIRAHPEYLSVVRSAARRTAELAGLGDQEVHAVTLALDEALTNVIRHSYGGPCCKPIIVKFRRRAAAGDKPSGLEFDIRDYGRQVDPGTIRSRDLDDIRPGGLGVHIIRSVMDEVEYSCPVDGGMQLHMVKYITGAPAHEAAPH
jgi:anti-sigma regulatory factor (Ser/Thr protein kinase)